MTTLGSAAKRPEDMTREELLDLVYSQREEGIRITFSGKDVAKQIARKVQPRTSRRLAKYSVGTEEEQARNQVIEGENLQAMVTLHRERGKVDLILTDPPYNTGRDFRYNDRWDEDPNDPDLGELVTEDDGARHTKWMKFMWPRLKVMRDLLKPTGVLAICIDDRELFHLGKMLDELFGLRTGSPSSTGRRATPHGLTTGTSPPPPSTSSCMPRTRRWRQRACCPGQRRWTPGTSHPTATVGCGRQITLRG